MLAAIQSANVRILGAAVELHGSDYGFLPVGTHECH